MEQLDLVNIFNHELVRLYVLPLAFLLLLVLSLYMKISYTKKMKASLHDANEQLRSILNSTSEAINITKVEGEIVYVNPAFEQMYGWSKEELIGNPLPIIPKHLAEESQKNKEILLGGKSIKNWESKFSRKDGSFIDSNTTISPLRNEHGIVDRFIAINRDETARKMAERNLRENEEKYRLIAENSSDLIRLIDKHGVVLYASPSHQNLLGFNSEELEGKQFLEMLHPEDITRISELFIKMCIHPELEIMEYRKKHKDGHYIDIEAHSSPVFDDENQLSHFIVVSRDVSERKKYEKELKRLAYQDPLTGIANRRMFQRKLEEVIVEAKQNDQIFAVLFLDCDRFKWVNDTMGHDVGDELLKQFVERVQRVLCPTDFLYRMGGDEFAIILTKIDSKKEISKLAEQITSSLQAPWCIHDQSFVTTCSIGISVYPFDGLQKHTLLTRADHALYLAKENGRNSYKFYTTELNKKLSRMAMIEKDIKQGIIDNNFYLVYQPQVNMRTGKTECIEVLLRYEHPILGNVPPDEFIPFCERTGFINELTIWLLEQVSKQYHHWIAEGYSPIKFSINLSPVTLQHERSSQQLMNALVHSTVPPEFIELELTEQALLDNLDEIKELLLEIKGRGISIALDDFGSGYSSLIYFKTLPIDKIKIDKSFVQDIFSEHGTKDQAIIKAIASLSKELNIEVVCEGVETLEQSLYLLKNSLTMAQGYYYSKPVTGPALESSGFLVSKHMMSKEILDL